MFIQNTCVKAWRSSWKLTSSGRSCRLRSIRVGCDGRPLPWVEDARSGQAVAFVFGRRTHQTFRRLLSLLESAHITVSKWITDAWCRAAGAGLFWLSGSGFAHRKQSSFAKLGAQAPHAANAHQTAGSEDNLFFQVSSDSRHGDRSIHQSVFLWHSTLLSHHLLFKYILGDSRFASVENMEFIVEKKKLFIFDMKSNRLAVLSEKDRQAGKWTTINELVIPNNTPVQVWLKDLSFPVLLTKQVFTNKDDSTGVRFLVSNDFSLTNEDFLTTYKKRWAVEEYHKSLKRNASVAKSPTRTVKTQSNHLFASILAYIKLEKLRFANKLNHFALKTKIYQQALKAAFKELTLLKAVACA